MIPRKLLKGDLHLLDLAGVGFQGADSFTTVPSSSTSAKANVSQSLLGFCQRRLSWHCERGGDYTVQSKLFATLTQSVSVRHKIRRLNVDLGALLDPIGSISMREAMMLRR